MFNNSDLQQFEKKGVSMAEIEKQLRIFKNGISYLKIDQTASVEYGIIRLSDEEKEKYIAIWNEFLGNSNKKTVKFVPASGAASRMFKDLFEFIESNNNSQFAGHFFNDIEKFAFYDLLDKKCKELRNTGLEQLLVDGYFKDVLKILLETEGLNYGNLPKGLLLFHRYINENRTPFLEHLVEGVQYTKDSNNVVRVHFTVSSEHKQLFDRHLSENIDTYAKRYNSTFEISFSEQEQSTDTIAVDKDNKPFREDGGTILLRPAGHGALIENLNNIDADIVFIKNIDNVVPDMLKDKTINYKKIIAGYLVGLQQQTFTYLKELENNEISDAKLQIISKFCQSRLLNINPNISELKRAELIEYLKTKLNRPIRVCGMVKNEGEPGGGPYMVYNQDGTISPQILETSQIDTTDEGQKRLIELATHFNPVDLVCGIKDYKNNRFNLLEYVDYNTCFISTKSKSGKELKALELPGLWNGSMSNWNTVFVEVPIDTFNPVKNINDLLRPQHQ